MQHWLRHYRSQALTVRSLLEMYNDGCLVTRQEGARCCLM